MLSDHDDDQPRRWRVALHADEGHRPALEGFAARHRAGLAGWDLRAAGPLAAALQRLGLRVRPLPAAPGAAGRAIAADVAAGELDALILFRDPFAAAGPAQDGGLLLRLADLHNVASATNLASAECLVRGLAPRALASRTVGPGPTGDRERPGPTRSGAALVH